MALIEPLSHLSFDGLRLAHPLHCLLLTTCSDMFTSENEISLFQLKSILSLQHPHQKSLYVYYVSVNINEQTNVNHVTFSMLACQHWHVKNVIVTSGSCI